MDSAAIGGTAARLNARCDSNVAIAAASPISGLHALIASEWDSKYGRCVCSDSEGYWLCRLSAALMVYPLVFSKSIPGWTSTTAAAGNANHKEHHPYFAN